MKTLNWKTAISTGVVGLALLGAASAFASSNKDDAAELQAFVTAHPELQSVITKIEGDTGGKVVDAEMDDEGGNANLVEFEVQMPDGSEQDMVYNMSDQSLTLQTDDSDHNEADDSDGGTETSEAGEAAEATTN